MASKRTIRKQGKARSASISERKKAAGLERASTSVWVKSGDKEKAKKLMNKAVSGLVSEADRIYKKSQKG